MYKQHLKNAMSIMLSVAMLTSSMFSNVVNVSAVTDDGITVETATSDDGITVESETNDDGIEIETAHLDSSVAVKDDGITMDGAITSGSKVTLTVAAENNLSETAKFQLYFANAVDNQQLPEDKTQWNDMIKNVPEKLSATANQVIVTDSNENETEAKATFMQDKDGDIATASYVEVEVPANSALHLDVDVSNDDAGKVFAIPYLKAASEDAYGKAVDISWQKDDSIQIEEDTSKDNTNASDDNGIIVDDDATSEDGIQIEEDTDTKGIIMDDKDSDKSDDTSKDTSDAEDVNGVIFDQTGADDSTGQTAEERAEEENARTVDGETEAEIEENENSDIIRYIPSTGETIDEKAELEADEKAFEENAPPQKEGYPQAESYIRSIETVAKKDRYFEAGDYKTKYKDTTLTVFSADAFDSSNWQADDTFTVVYKEVLKDDESYYWYDSVKYMVVDDASDATIKSEECDKILPDWVPTEGGVGVPKLAETVLDGKMYTVPVNDKNWSLDSVANGYDMGRFRSSVHDAGDFDITKAGTYIVRYRVTYFMAPNYPWYVDATINVVDNKAEGSQIQLLNDSLKVLMDDELIEYGQKYTTDKTEVTLTVQAQNTNTFNAIKPVVKVLKGEDEVSDSVTKTDEKEGVYTYVVKLSGKETVTIDDTANTCIFSHGKGYAGAWRVLDDNALTKDDVNDTEQLFGNVNDTQINEIETYASSGTKTFNGGGTGSGYSSTAHDINTGAVVYNGIYVSIKSATQTSIVNWVNKLDHPYTGSELTAFKNWLKSVKINAVCKSTHDQAGWSGYNDYTWNLTVRAKYNSSTSKLTVSVTADGNTNEFGNYQWLHGVKSFTAESATGSITVKKRLINQDWASRWYRIQMTAKFTLYEDSVSDDNEVATISLKTEDATSKIATFDDLPYGKYVLKETYACKGCIINDTNYPITLSRTHPDWTPSDSKVKTLITNGYITNQNYYYCGVILKKVETSTGTETPLPGAVFKIEYKPSSTSAAEATWYCQTGSEGEVWLKSPYILPSWNGISSDEAPLNNAGDPCLPIGVVTIQEVQAPSGYTIGDSSVKTIFLRAPDSGRVIDYNIPVYSNTPSTWDVNVRARKLDATDGSPLSGAVIGIYSDSNCTNELARYTTGSNGYTDTYTYSALGSQSSVTLWCQEISAPPGYVRNYTKYSLTFSKSEKGQTKTFGTNVSGNTGIPNYPEDWHVWIRTKKVDATDGSPLSGAEFGVYYNSSCSGTPFTTLRSESNGYTDTYRLDFEYDETGGTYYCQEISAPYGYQRNARIYPLTITKSDKGDTLTFGESTLGGTAVPDYPEGWNVSVRAMKVDAADGTPLSGATFGLWRNSSCSGSPFTTLTSRSNGYTETYDFSYDYDESGETIYCQEMSAPAGYHTNTKIYPLTLSKADDGQTLTFGESTNGKTAIPDTKKVGWKASFNTRKLDAETNAGLAGAEFTVYSNAACTDIITVLKSGSNGWTNTYEMTFDYDDDNVTVYCVETKAPDGYERDEGIYKLIFVKANDAGKTKTFGGTGIYDNRLKEEWLLRYRVKKVDANGNPLSGAVFRVYDNASCSGTPIKTFRTGSDGYTSIETIKRISEDVKSYKLYCREAQAPAGYVVDKTIYPLTWTYDSYKALKDKGDDSGELQTFGGEDGIVNVKDFWRIRYRVKKVDAEGNALAGAVFHIYDNENCSGDPVAEITTGKDGCTAIQTVDQIPVTSTSYKLYCKEYSAPDGYTVNTKIYPLTWSYDTYKVAKDQGDETGELQIFGGDTGISNAKDYWKLRYRVKKVDAEGNALAGAVFRIYNDKNCSGTPVAELTTGKDGFTPVQTVDNIWTMTKSYKLYCKEYKAPAGYAGSTDVYPLTWSYDSYKALKDRGDETGELQTFGGDAGIVNTKDLWRIRYRIKKVDEDGKVLENAVFRVYDNENCDGTPVAELTTGKDGFTDVQTVDQISVTVTSYKLYCKEYKAPEGYVASKDVYPLTWSYDSYKALKDKGDETGELQTFGGDTGITNTKAVWKLRYRIKKVDEDGKALENAVFRIYDNENCSGTPVAELTTGKDGFTPVQTVENIWTMTKSYKLYCKEYKAPEGYVASKDVYPLTWSYDSYKALKDKGDETGELQTFGGDTGITNTKAVWKLRYRIKKVGENGKALAGAVFRVYDNENCDGTPLAELTTGKDGFTSVQTVENIWALTKSYKLYCKEYRAPEGYVVNTDVYPLTWSYDSYKTLKDKGDETGELQTFGGDAGIENERDVWKLRYRVKKVGEDGKVLENAVFRIYNDKNCSGTPIAELTTGKDGFTDIQTIENISVGTTSYKLYCKEYSAPEGYVATTLVYPLTFKYDSYKALKDKGDTSGELQTFGGDHGIINVKTGTGYAYVEKTSKASKDILNLSGYSLAGAEFTITDGNGFNEVMTTDENGISNQIRLPEYYNEEPDGANEWDDTSDDTDTVALNDDNGIVTEDAESGISAQAYIPVTTEYTITETKAPKGHTINKKPLKIRVTMPVDKNKVFKLDFADEPIFVKAGLNIRKLSAKGNAIEGVVFKTEYLDEDKVVRTWYLTSDKDGNVKLDRDHLSTAGYRNDAFFTYNNKIVLPIGGVLRMTEVSAPAQYKVDDTPFTFDLSSENATLTKTIYNDLEKGKLKVVKHGTDGKTPLEGVEFELKFVKESETATSDKQNDFKRLLNVGETVKATTDANGEITWENLDQGDYQITETKTVPGYTLLKDPINVTLPLQMTKSKADAYGNVNFNAAKEDKNYTKKWFFFEYSFDITNTPILHLPETGATGTWTYGFVGLGIAMAAGVAGMVVTKCRRRKKQDK